MKPHYDVVIIGSGLGGLVAAVILAKEGRSVCVLEKNSQFGGNLQTFVRDKTIFDTGIHYIGGLGKGENLHRYFSYLGIMEGLKLRKMDEKAYDVISFEEENQEFPHAQGHSDFVEELSKFFPSERGNLMQYCDRLTEACDTFPLYNIRPEAKYDTRLLSIGAQDEIGAITQNETLRAILAGSNFLYAGTKKSPFYIHALSVNSYIESAWRCINGGSQITKQFVKQLRMYGGDIFKYREVVGFETAQNKIVSARMKNGDAVSAGIFISDIELKTLMDLVGEASFRKPFYNRVKSLPDVISAFSLYIVFKPGTFKYFNHNIYHFTNTDAVWTAQDYNDASWPKAFMVSMNATSGTDGHSEGMTVIAYMKYAEVRQWDKTFNTTAEPAERGENYEEFKARKAEKLLSSVEKKFHGIRDAILSAHTSSPLSYRDYIGSHNGSMYGYERDASDPMKTFISPKTRIDNLYLTGQSVSVHGVLGVTIGAVSTCCEILGRDYLVGKINSETGS